MFSPLIGIIYWFDDTLTKISLNYQFIITHCALDRGTVSFLRMEYNGRKHHDRRKGDNLKLRAFLAPYATPQDGV